ncbi:MAG: hypothetical protein A2126_00445 [Candidatus Woykebacteria bacterium GWB1_45_5]|uniref:YlxR domain-containing protein n=2 Tax=Candidatus Woykeibacteriota TaxID=1817899 RepID=A0A1G1W365_9BACT|nr:MAG: hypothetical protein A2113_02805 [Candidatus Woykebacteria bacterium GWA1_44_8]OGY22638.1 MAG: hypothetical protein A2126_00445 [Candidatus Woykebacteria bacterium GWB1_45_5]
MEFETNPCIRCGKERIKGKVKFINTDSRKTKLTMYVCPDRECQKIVEAELAAKEERKLALTNRRTHYPPKKKSN